MENWSNKAENRDDDGDSSKRRSCSAFFLFHHCGSSLRLRRPHVHRAVCVCVSRHLGQFRYVCHTPVFFSPLLDPLKIVPSGMPEQTTRGKGKGRTEKMIDRVSKTFSKPARAQALLRFWSIKILHRKKQAFGSKGISAAELLIPL